MPIKVETRSPSMNSCPLGHRGVNAVGLAEERDLCPLRQDLKMWQHLGGTAQEGHLEGWKLCIVLTTKSKISAPDVAEEHAGRGSGCLSSRVRKGGKAPKMLTDASAFNKSLFLAQP